MVEHVQLGTEVLSLDFDSLLCEHCKAKIEAAKEAKRALQNFHELMGGRAPAPAEPSVPGAKLTREERLEKARRVLASSNMVPKGAAQTSNGTILAQPWQHMPRKQIKKGAEADLHKVVSGKMTRMAWCDKHGYSRSLLEKRLSILAPDMHGPRKTRAKPTHAPPPSYASPKQRLSDEDMLRVLRKETTGNKLAKELGMPAGTVYRIIEDNERRLRKRATKSPTTRTRPDVNISDEEWRAVYDGNMKQADLGRKHNLTSAGILYRFKQWMAAHQLETRFTHGAGPTIRIADQDLARAVSDRDYIAVLARKHGCSINAVRSKVREYALRYGVPDEDAVAEQIVGAETQAPSDEHIGELFDKLGGATTE